MDDLGIDARPAVAETSSDLVRFLIGTVEALNVTLFAVHLVRALRRQIDQVLSRSPLTANARAAANGVAIAVYVSAGVLVFALLGVSWSSVAAIPSAATVVMAIALHDRLRNLVAGAHSQMEPQITVGNWVGVNDLDGTVETIGLLAAVPRTDTDERTILAELALASEIVAGRRADRADQSILAPSGLATPPSNRPSSIARVVASVDGVRGSPSMKQVTAGTHGVDGTGVPTHAPRGDLASALVGRLHKLFPTAMVGAVRT